jgi:hypothetical protein
MHNQRLLIVGASENLINADNQNYHYITLLTEQYQCVTNNMSIGGMSNDEIFYRCLQEVIDTEYDLVIVMWTSILRKWIYFDDNNIDDYTILGINTISGHRHNDKAVKDYHKIWYSFFCNNYIGLRNLVGQILSLQHVLQSQNVPYIMINDFDNGLSNILNFSYDSHLGFSNIDDLKKTLDFENRPDDYILSKLYRLQNMTNKVDTDHWIDFANFRFQTSRTDTANDGSGHAGPQSHLMLFKLLQQHVDTRKILN